MSLKENIEKDIKTAMLEKNQSDLLALRSIKSAILIAETEKGSRGVLTEDAEVKILAKAAKQRKDSADIFQQQARTDLAEKELMELEVINRYLPKQLSEEEIKMEVRKIIEETGSTDIKEMGRVMGLASKQLAGKTDGKTLSTIVKSLLS
jgi:uncharacterized protein YqeY